VRFWKTREFGTALVLLAMLLACEIAARVNSGTSFLLSPQLPRIFATSAFVGIAAIGACTVILTGGVDLSAGSVMTLGAIVLAWLGSAGWPAPLALAGGLAAATAVGLTNGLLVAKLRMPSFIATLGFLSIARGLGFRASGGLSIDVSSDASWIFTPLAKGAVATMLVLAAVAGVFLARFRWGRYVYAIGGNEEAARFAGVPVDRVKIGVYAVASLFAGLAGCALALTHGTAYVAMGNGYELQIIAACAIGGLSFTGGEGSVAGAVLGAVTLETLRSLLIQLHVKSDYIEIAYGAAIILAVGVDLIRHRLGRRTA
jgi:ribose/xylose/arabinose/galactoside ABC-type transport system permease subunit